MITNLKPWFYRKHGELTYEMTQVLTGHGCFQSFLHRIGKKASPICAMCESGQEDDAEHTVYRCSEFTDERRRLTEYLGGRFEPENLIDSLLGDEENGTR